MPVRSLRGLRKIARVRAGGWARIVESFVSANGCGAVTACARRKRFGGRWLANPDVKPPAEPHGKLAFTASFARLMADRLSFCRHAFAQRAHRSSSPHRKKNLRAPVQSSGSARRICRKLARTSLAGRAGGWIAFAFPSGSCDCAHAVREQQNSRPSHPHQRPEVRLTLCQRSPSARSSSSPPWSDF